MYRLQITHLQASLDKKVEECVQQKIKTSEVVNKLVILSSSIKPDQAKGGYGCMFL